MRDATLDGAPLTADDAVQIAGVLGRLWRTFRRRSLSPELRDALVSGLLECRLMLVPTGLLGPAESLDTSRYDIKHIANLLKVIAQPAARNAVCGSSVADRRVTLSLATVIPAPSPIECKDLEARLLEAAVAGQL
jgi:hypothetical protein